MLNELLTAGEVEQETGGKIRKARAYELARQNILPHCRLGRRVFFPRSAVEDFIRHGGRPLDGPGGWRRAPK